MTNLAFSAPNRHVADCGTPPAINADDYAYTGYFQNIHGEQWIFMIAQDGATTVLGGDIGWDTPITIPPELPTGRLEGMILEGWILGEEERDWLGLCWTTSKDLREWIAAGRPKHEPKPKPNGK